MAAVHFSSDDTDSSLERRQSVVPLHRKYLRAFHDYQPDNTAINGKAGSVSITAPLSEGDIVLVHLTHSNGWADGTILSTGHRGWIPTNYCQSYDPRPIRPLLHALTKLWNYLSSGANGRGVFEDRQDYVQGLVAGVRRMLEHCDCLHRDDGLIKKNVALRRTRKSLLADLSTLIKCRDDIHNTFSDSTEAVLWSTVDEYLTAAFKVACRAVRFLDIWSQSSPLEHSRSDSPQGDGPESDGVIKMSPPSTYPNFHRGSPEKRLSRLSLMQTSPDPTKSSLVNGGVDGYTDIRHGSPSTTSRDLRQSQVFASSPPPIILSSDPADGRASILLDADTSDLATERLTLAHEQFLGEIGAFIGLHLQPRSSVDLLATTQRSVQAAEDLLLVVKSISDRSPGDAQQLASAVSNMRQKLTRLADLANRLCKIPVAQEEPDSVEIVDPEDGQGFVAAATDCVRAAGHCTTQTRRFLDQKTGDFLLKITTVELRELGLGLNFGQPPRAEIASKDWAENVPGAANPPHHLEPDTNTTNTESHLQDPESRPSCLLRSTTDDTNNFTLSTVLPCGNMRRPESSPPLAAPCDLTTTPKSPKSLSSPSQVKRFDVFPRSPRVDHKSQWTPPNRKSSLGLSVTEGSSAYQDSLRNSIGSLTSPTSTRATTPDRYLQNSRLKSSSGAHGSVVSVATDEGSINEAEVLVRSHAHELLYNKEGQIVGGTLPALVENLTSQYTTPDPTYNSTFLLTFRLFTNALELAQTLIDRYQYTGDAHVDGSPARLRVFNLFKSWLESHYLTESDAPALPIIHAFATEQLSQQFPGPAKRLAELVEIASQRNITCAANQLVSCVGKTSVSLGDDTEKYIRPHAKINKDQLYLLAGSTGGVTRACLLVDLDPVELARQLTLLESAIFCAIKPGELLGLEWTKKNDKAGNVLAMSRFSTALTHLVADSILSTDLPKRRVLVLKHWIKIAKTCLNLHNYSSLMAIACSLTSSTISRLRLTWDRLPAKSKAIFEEIKEVVDVSRNYAALRQRLQTHNAPCLPFVGMYLTDLTFVDAGNQSTRPLPSSEEDDAETRMVINFDKYIRSARVVDQLQRYQVPFRLQHVLEIQAWLNEHLEIVRKSEDCTVQALWRRSQALEPRMPHDEEKKQQQQETTEDKENKPVGGGLMGGLRRPKNKPSMNGLNALVSRSRLPILHRVKTAGSADEEH